MDVIQNHRTARSLGLLVLGLTAASLGSACSSKSGGGSSVGALPSDVRAIVFLQRMPRTDNGNVFMNIAMRYNRRRAADRAAAAGS